MHCILHLYSPVEIHLLINLGVFRVRVLSILFRSLRFLERVFLRELGVGIVP